MGPMVPDIAQKATMRPPSESGYACRCMQVGFGMFGPASDSCFLMPSERSAGRDARVLHETDYERQ